MKNLTALTMFFLATLNLMSQSEKNSFKINLGPTGGNQVGTNNYAYYGKAKTLVGFNASFEYQRQFTKLISLGVGLEYNLNRYGFTSTYTDTDSSGNEIPAGTLDYSFNTHNIGMPIRLYFNFINNDKFKLYSYLGLNPKFTLDMVMAAEWHDLNNNLISRQSSSIYEMPYGIMMMNILKIEGQVGLGMNYKISKKFFIDANFMFGIDCVSNYRTFYYQQFQYRFGGNTGVGYMF